MLRRFKKWSITFVICICVMKGQALELPDCDAIAMMLAPLAVVPDAALKPPSKLPLTEVITRIGRPNKWKETGSVYRWSKDGYVLSLVITQVGHNEHTTTSIKLPVKQNLTLKQIQADTPLEFTKVMRASSNNKLATAERLLGLSPKLKMFSYSWSCYSYAAVVNGYPLNRESQAVIDFDEKGNWINATF
jgi:hypothetical protein